MVKYKKEEKGRRIVHYANNYLYGYIYAFLASMALATGSVLTALVGRYESLSDALLFLSALFFLINFVVLFIIAINYFYSEDDN